MIAVLGLWNHAHTASIPELLERGLSCSELKLQTVLDPASEAWEPLQRLRFRVLGLVPAVVGRFSLASFLPPGSSFEVGGCELRGLHGV